MLKMCDLHASLRNASSSQETFNLLENFPDSLYIYVYTYNS